MRLLHLQIGHQTAVLEARRRAWLEQAVAIVAGMTGKPPSKITRVDIYVASVYYKLPPEPSSADVRLDSRFGPRTPAGYRN